MPGRIFTFTCGDLTGAFGRVLTIKMARNAGHLPRLCIKKSQSSRYSPALWEPWLQMTGVLHRRLDHQTDDFL